MGLTPALRTIDLQSVKGNSVPSRQTKLLCLTLDKGKLVWQRDTAKDWNVPDHFFGFGCTPILEAPGPSEWGEWSDRGISVQIQCC